MKKLFPAIVLTLFAFVAVAADYEFPGWRCTDAAKINAALADAKTDAQKLQCRILLAVYDKTFASFTDLRTAVETVVNADTVLPQDVKLSTARDTVKILAWSRKQNLADAYAWAKLNPSKYDLCIYENWSRPLKLSDTEVYQGIVRCLEQKYNYKPSVIRVCVEKLIAAAPGADVKTQKADLQRLNRRFSPLLLTDRAAYEPIVAMIRTAIDTY